MGGHCRNFEGVIIVHRFFANNLDINDGKIVLVGDNARHAIVLRLDIGEEIVVCDGKANDHYCVVDLISKDEVHAKVVRSETNAAEPPIFITLFQGLPKGDKMDEIVEKCVELGISRIVPVVTARCITKPSPRDNKKSARWQKIAEAAAKQSRRGIIPEISSVLKFDDALQSAKNHDAVFACYELEDKLILKNLLKTLPDKITSLAFFVGPEGGFSENEVAKFTASNIATVSLGQRIMRTETAGAAVLANILYELEGRS
jgi:16S rRNA (uracil1498-N3)-methyltransferase